MLHLTLLFKSVTINKNVSEAYFLPLFLPQYMLSSNSQNLETSYIP